MSKKIAILTDSSAGFKTAEIKQLGIHVIPLHIILNNEIDILDTEEETTKHNFYEVVKTGTTKTSQASTGELMVKYDEILKTYDEIIHYPIAEKLSSQYATAYVLSQDEKYRGKVHVVRNHTAAFALKTLIIYANELTKQNLSVKEIITKTNELEQKTYMAMIPGSLDRLSKGGRVGKVLLSLINLFKIKILIQWGEYPKKIGSSRTLNNLIETLVETWEKFKKTFKINFQLFVLKTSECASKVWDNVTQKLNELKVNYHTENLANIFVAHAGLNTIAFIAVPQIT
ncbi:DegV family protein [Spiroplasma citri]|uniref:DegV family EDD domain-containing protein n=1 Tax=Spiroplasma citri TaxID=2133 RepID=A0AAJ4EKW9_SPICI|nr:DegV family protein [Spiroplasma citri]APE75620.1 DegV family protein [Spiroplasma citri]QIA67811.1 DegV family EDD domain-containing protein [Spiroplasma citri]QIA69664.1 DegV family EDD domain-containing protein [Spiroplasma citri]QIA71533.1 DegV family EDD domain-containing protein [Spiroplasma citri]QIA73644.1 DegV family EDD domain-containing protein [Spiroplasma citri]